MAQHWQFRQDEHEQWHWTRFDDGTAATESHGAFENQVDCFLDAVRCAVRARRADGESDPAH